MIDCDELLKTNKSSVDPFDYHVSICGLKNYEVIKFIQLVINKYSYETIFMKYKWKQ